MTNKSKILIEVDIDIDKEISRAKSNYDKIKEDLKKVKNDLNKLLTKKKLNFLLFVKKNKLGRKFFILGLALGVITALIALYIKIKKSMDECVQRCKLDPVSNRKDCFNRCKLKSYERELALNNAIMSKCNTTKNPTKCKNITSLQKIKINNKIDKLKSEIN